MKPNVKRHAVVQPQDQSIRLIPLTQGHNATVDAVDYAFLMQWNWFAKWDRHTKSFYARRHEGKKFVMMHVEVMGKGKLWDHANRDTLDNRRANLRESTRSQNNVNAEKYCTNSSGFKGVSARRDRWRARLGVNGKQINLGTFRSAEEAARAYDVAAASIFGKFAHRNYPS